MDKAVLFDLQVFAEQRHGGVSRYFRELSKALDQRGRWQPRITPGVHVADIESSMESIGPRLQIPPVPRGVRVTRSLNKTMTSLMRWRYHKLVQVHHPTWYHRPSIEAVGGIPLVITIHDMIPEMWPDVTTTAQVDDRRWAIQQAAVILCVSTATRNDLLERHPEVAEKTLVAYPGLTPLVRPEEAAPPTGSPYFVYVGKRGSYKDFSTCLRAFELARINLVVIGGGPPGDGLARRLASSGMSDLVRFEVNPSDSRLASILEGASGLVSTSRQEGFGIPPLEALSLGTPIVLSDIPVYREVYGDWARFFPAGGHEALAETLLDLISSSPPVPTPEELSARFSWSATAAVAEEAYLRALG